MPGYPTDRVIVYNRDATFAFELTPEEQRSRKRIEEINGEHSLTIKTTRKLTEGMRLITQDDTGKIREHVVYKPDEGHNQGKYAIGTYFCMWSLQYDLMSSYAHEHAEPGMGSSCTSRNAVIAALDGQALWTVGTCDVPAVAAGKGCVMIGVSDWERLSLVVKYWHGEIDAEIVMDDTRIVSRKVNFLAHLGSSTVTRRFDWGEDLTNISRTPDPGPYYCRIVPLGRGQREYAEDDETEFDWPLDISEETPDGRVYIEDSESALVFRTKLPDGTWHYPTKVVKYDEDDPELLLNAGNADLYNHTRPGCSYEANVLQFVRAGMDAKGVQLGDNTQCVDFGFNPDAGLTVEGRVTRLEMEDLAPETETNLTIGDIAPTFAQTMQELIGRQTASISDGIKRVEGGGTIVYLQHLLDEINAEINGTGGYSYLVPGEGIVTYDRRVADPLIGTEATQVTQIKGGNIRIANTKNPGFAGINDWEWKTVIVSGHVAAELVTAAHITAGYIGSSNDAVFLDFENHVFEIGNATTIGNTTVQQLLSDVASAGIDTIEYGTSASSATAPTSWSTTAPTSVAKGSWLWIRTTYKNGTISTTKAYAGTDGQDGADGADGVGIASTAIEYGTSADAATQPTTWSTTPPTSLPQATWLWVRTTYTYSDQSTKSVYTKSYVGTDGEDGASVYVASSTKSGDTTTVVLSDGTTLTIVDGEDGTNGTNGLNGYVHTAWANSADGSTDFSTTVSANKLYLGVYTDNAQADSQSPSAYSWSLIKGADGQSGEDGIGIASIIPQYYLSTSSSSATGGSWSSNPPTWSANHYIWTRSLITWDTTPSTTTTTTAVYDEALTQANQQAVESAKVATNYITDGSSGTDFGKTGVSSKMRILPTGMEIFDGNGESALFAGLQNSNSIVRVGKASGSGNVVMSSEGYVDVRNASTVMAHFGYGEGTNSSGGTSIAPYYDVGRRKSNTTVGNYSVAEGYLSTASGYCSHAEGADTTASGYNSHSEGNSTTASSSDSHAEGYYTKATKSAAHAEGYRTTASGNYSHAEGSYTTASGESTHTEGYSTKATGQNSHAEGFGTEANGAHQHVSGAYNVTHFYHLLIIGNGSADNARSNALYLSQAGNLWIAGTLTQNSDRRLKEHHAYLGEDASDFIRALKPALYTKDGVRHVGFYAQDVQAAEPEEWGTDTVTAQHTDESLDFDPLTLDYNALIAPLVAYAQQLEKRIDEQQETIEAITKRLDALEGR